jgi:hypothetical protein
MLSSFLGLFGCFGLIFKKLFQVAGWLVVVELGLSWVITIFGLLN